MRGTALSGGFGSEAAGDGGTEQRQPHSQLGAASLGRPHATGLLPCAPSGGKLTGITGGSQVAEYWVFTTQVAERWIVASSSFWGRVEWHAAFQGLRCAGIT